MAAELNVTTGTAVVVVDDRLGEVIPAAAFPVLRNVTVVHASDAVPRGTCRALGVAEQATPDAAELVRRAGAEPVALVTTDPAASPAAELRAAGAELVHTAPPGGVELLSAASVMDRLRSPGGCPWDGKQDHDSLRKYLVEESYELLDAIAQRDRAAMREELGDVLLQVLFHARVAAEDVHDPFDVDEVATDLVAKLVSRHPNVFAADGDVLDPEAQYARWEELKQQEKQRDSIVDGVPFGQPALALAAKLVQRAQGAGAPVAELAPGDGVGATLFGIAARARVAGADPEDELRAVAVGFAERIRTVESRAAAAGRDLTELSPAEWREWLADAAGSSELRGE